MHAGNAVQDGGGRWDFQNTQMVAIWQLAFWSWSLFWKTSAIPSDRPPEPILIFPSFTHDWFDLPWFISSWWWQWWRGNHPESDSKNAYSKKMLLPLLSLCYISDHVVLNCMNFLSSCMHHPPCYINSYGKNRFDTCWPQLLHLWDWMFAINLVVWASFQPRSEQLHFHCRHLPQINQVQSRVKDGKMG